MGIFDKLKKKPARKPVEDTATEDVVKDEKLTPAAEKVENATQAQEIKVNSVSAGVLLKPVITEKSLMMQADGKYTFFVRTDTNKYKVAQAVKEVYGTAPVKVRMVKQQAQQLNKWGRQTGVQKARKKAIVTMPKGTTLDLTA